LPPQKSDIDRLGNPLAISRLLWPLYAAGRPQCRPSSSVEQPCLSGSAVPFSRTTPPAAAARSCRHHCGRAPLPCAACGPLGGCARRGVGVAQPVMERSGDGRNAMRAHPRSLLSIILLPLRLFSTQFGDEQADLPNLKAGVGWQRSMAALRSSRTFGRVNRFPENGRRCQLDIELSLPIKALRSSLR